MRTEGLCGRKCVWEPGEVYWASVGLADDQAVGDAWENRDWDGGEPWGALLPQGMGSLNNKNGKNKSSPPCEAATSSQQNYNPNATPENLPQGESEVDIGGGRTDVYMQDSHGNISYTPDYAAYSSARPGHINIGGVITDLTAIIFGAVAGSGEQSAQQAIAATGAAAAAYGQNVTHNSPSNSCGK